LTHIYALAGRGSFSKVLEAAFGDLSNFKHKALMYYGEILQTSKCDINDSSCALQDKYKKRPV